MKGRATPPKITADAAVALAAGKPGLVILEVLHDDWCVFFRTGRADDCNCEPIEQLVSYTDLKREGRLQ